jgi:hypothetical protein
MFETEVEGSGRTYQSVVGISQRHRVGIVGASMPPTAPGPAVCPAASAVPTRWPRRAWQTWRARRAWWV